MSKYPLRFLLLILAAAMLACATPLSTDLILTPLPTATRDAVVGTPTPRKAAATATPESSATPVPQSVWLDPILPANLVKQVQISTGVSRTDSQEAATLHVTVVHTGEHSAAWVYVLVAPFPSLDEGVGLEALRSFWLGEGKSPFHDKALMLSTETLAIIESMWGKAAGSSVQVVAEDQLVQQAWAAQPAWALIPFEKVEPRWKVLQLDGISPLDRDFNPDPYPLIARIGVAEGTTDLVKLPSTNRDDNKMTRVVMSGTTALVRAIAAKMDKNGVTYPAQLIKDWLRSGDFTHVSNEVSFDTQCPLGNPSQPNLLFCSRPEYLDLLKFSGVNIVELTGNHLMDVRREALPFTFDLYTKNKMRYYAAGMNQTEARAPLLVEHNGNKLAFIGCNSSGPPSVWATASDYGAAKCDYEWMKGEIRNLRDAGYLPIVTLQHFEYYNVTIAPLQERDFLPLAEAGAVIVSGSQSHYPQGFAFSGGSLVHYGLGNLFFDQMYVPDDGPWAKVYDAKKLKIPGTRLEFIDRHIFYDGRYINTELLTAVLEDYSQPRPMTEQERTIFLQDAFAASKWGNP